MHMFFGIHNCVSIYSIRGLRSSYVSSSSEPATTPSLRDNGVSKTAYAFLALYSMKSRFIAKEIESTRKILLPLWAYHS
jgi:hypothetical protein